MDFSTFINDGRKGVGETQGEIKQENKIKTETAKPRLVLISEHPCLPNPEQTYMNCITISETDCSRLYTIQCLFVIYFEANIQFTEVMHLSSSGIS